MAIAYTYNLSRIPAGPRGTEATLRAMERLVESGSRDPAVILYAQQAVRNTPEYGKRAEVEAILADARRSMRYTSDPVSLETVKDPSYTLQEIRRYGRAVMDCDDVSVWVATLLRCIGIPTRFKVIKDDPVEFTHVYLEAFLEGAWVPVDPIARRLPVGREPQGLFGSAVFTHDRLSGIRRNTMYKSHGLGAEAATTPTGWDAIAAAISNPLQNLIQSGINKYLPGMQTQAPATTPLPKVIVMQNPGFFQKRDASGQIVLDPVKVGGTVAVVGLLGWMVMRRRK